MLNYNEIKERKIIIFENEPWEVLDSHVFRKQQRKPVNQTKLRNLLSGRVLETSFQSSDTVHEADVEKRDIVYLYTNPKNGEMWFADSDNPKNRFTLDQTIVGAAIGHIPENTILLALLFNHDDDERIIGIQYPMKIDVRVAEAPPSIKGDTATGGKKVVVTETGANVNTPLFINTGDVISINPETGEYSERVEKA